MGLPPVKRIFNGWMHSPDRVIGIFPPWFGPPAADWPPQTVLTGFPLYDEADITPIDPQLEKFLDDGPPPIAFTPGSAMRHGQRFFTVAVRVCRMLGRRGLLVSRHTEHVPAELAGRRFATWNTRRSARCCPGARPSCITGGSGLPPRPWRRGFRNWSCRWPTISRTMHGDCNGWAWRSSSAPAGSRREPPHGNWNVRWTRPIAPFARSSRKDSRGRIRL